MFVISQRLSGTPDTGEDDALHHGGDLYQGFV
jgi:hypothetical protein